MITHVSPLGSMDMRRSWKWICLAHRQQHLYQLFRNCSLAVLIRGA
ncbi:pyrimidine/purine nucleosidase domain-containing protein [Klebsiella pneumoniae]